MRRRKGVFAAIFGVLLLAAAGLRGRLRRYLIAEESMRPALASGDWTIAQRVRGYPKRGAVVVFRHPDQGDMELVKRVVGLPGEHVTVANGQVHIDGKVLAEPWADGPTRPDGEWALGTGELFVLGDSRAISAADSRTLGAIPVDRASWRITARYWPPGSIGRL
jgi:signal peptidase I